MAGETRFSEGIGTLSLDTDSRECTPEEAYARTLAGARALADRGVEQVYKSVDSTLRGNLGAEIDAVMDAFGFSAALIAPAFPLYGRTTQAGIHFLNGVPIAQSSISRDPTRPVRESEMVRVLAAQSGRAAARLSLETVRGGEASVCREIARLQRAGTAFFVPDVEREEDLAILARVSARLPEVLCVGSTGLARHVATAWTAETGASPKGIPLVSGAMLVVAGSAAQLTGAQIAKDLLDGTVGRVKIDPVSAIESGQNPEFGRAATQLESMLFRGGDAIVYVDAAAEARKRTAQVAAGQGLSPEYVAGRISGMLAQLAKRALETKKVGILALTGGDTAKAVMEAIGASGLRLMGEIEPGIPTGMLLGTASLAVVTKAGAFGSEEIFANIRKAFRGGWEDD